MPDWCEPCKKEWWHEGKCTNGTDRDIEVCVQSGPGEWERRTLSPGQSTPPGVDCEGYITRDGPNIKVNGRFGTWFNWTQEVDPNTWPGCQQRLLRVNQLTAGGITVEPPQVGEAQIQYFVHCEQLGDSALVPSGWFVGTRGQACRLEGFQINLLSADVGLQYMAHLQDIGDTPWVPQGTFIGTRGQARRLEGFAIQLTQGGEKYSVLYRAHLQDIGDTDWYANGAFCGTRGQARRVEGIVVWIVKSVRSLSTGLAAIAPGSGQSVVLNGTSPIRNDPEMDGVHF